MINVLISFGLWTAATLAALSPLGVKFDKRADGLPTLTLPYATYRAKSFNSNGDVRYPLFTPPGPRL